jgi:hypothetical protein
VGLPRRNTWVLGITLWTGCMQAGDNVLQPDPSDNQASTSNNQGVASGGTAAPQGQVQSQGGSKASAGSGSKPQAGGAAISGSAAEPPVDSGMPEDYVGAAGSAGAGSGGTVAMGMAGSGTTPPPDAGPSMMTSGASDPECDFNGIWMAKQMTVSEALGLPQTSNNWYYLELKQSGDAAEVSKHFDCGIEVRGSATVTLSKPTLTASITHNLQAGRKISVARSGASCSFEAARFWSIRGADELRFLPGEPNPGRDFPDDIAAVATAKPLPTAQMTDGAIDIDMDGKLGIAFQVTGIVMGTRNSVQRDWTRWFTEPGYEIAASADWATDLEIRADFDNEESIIDPTSGLLVSNSAPSGSAKHVLILRFLGRDASDARAAAVIKPDDVDTCYAIQDALPAGTIE